MKKKKKTNFRKWMIAIILSMFLFALFTNIWSFITEYNKIILITTSILLGLLITLDIVKFSQIKKLIYRRLN
ncbi:MAG: hypothetical protein ACP6IY_09655 [Promethearchaeia archaeon]